MLCAIIAVLIMASMAVVFAPVAHADNLDNVTTIELGYSIYGLKSDVEAHFQYVEISDFRKGSTQTTTPLERVKWFRLYYQYENHGDTTADGDLKLLFYDDKGNQYKLDDRTYTGDTVSPHSIGSLKFVELPISKDSNIVTISVIKGFEAFNFTVPQPGESAPTPVATITPTAMPTSTVAPTPTATPTGAGSGGCLPLLPFALVATIGLVGVIAGKKVNRK